jgi:uncharacterized protein YbaR (Trm112 family)
MNKLSKYYNVTNNEVLACPNCKGTDLIMHKLRAQLWEVTFGENMLTEGAMVGFGCKKCGFIFLMASDAVKIRDEKP